MNKSDSDDTLLEEVYLSNSSLLSESTNFSDDASNIQKITITDQPNTNKRKNRFVTAFRSFRKKKTETKSLDSPITDNLSESQPKSVKGDTKRGRASRLVKRLSMSGIKRNKKSTGNLKRETPEGATLSVSEISLVEVGVDENISVVKSASKIPRKGDQLQITISGKKIERRKDSIVKPTSDTEIPETEPSKPQRKSKKFNITVSDQDTSPNVQAPPIPYSIRGSDISISSISTVEKISHTHSFEQSSICSSTGVIKKASFRKHKNRPVSMSVSKTGSLERGRRFPRPADDVKTDSATGTTIDSPSGSVTTDESLSKPSKSDLKTDDKPKIEFEVGTKVRPLSTPNLNRIVKTTVNYSVRGDEFNSLETSKCSESSSESKSDTSRRRIAYVAAPSISFAEDEPADSLLSREPLSHLSGISEYNSLDSDFSLPPLFGNVGVDDGVGGVFVSFFENDFFCRIFVFLFFGLCERLWIFQFFVGSAAINIIDIMLWHCLYVTIKFKKNCLLRSITLQCP